MCVEVCVWSGQISGGEDPVTIAGSSFHQSCVPLPHRFAGYSDNFTVKRGGTPDLSTLPSNFQAAAAERE